MVKQIFNIVKAGQYTINDVDEVRKALGKDARFTKGQAIEQTIALYDDYDLLLKESNLISSSVSNCLISF